MAKDMGEIIKESNKWNEDHGVTNPIGDNAAFMAIVTNPEVSDTVREFVAEVAETGVKEALEGIKSGEITLGDPEAHGYMSILFKNEADPLGQYGVVNIEFDSQGNFVESLGFKSDSEEAQKIVDFIKKTDTPETDGAERMEKGYRTIVTPTTFD